MSSDEFVRENVAVHDAISRKYERLHVEIFNPVEQERLHESLRYALGYIRFPASLLSALDYGSGTGNLTKHLLDLGFHVRAADVSRSFLAIIENKFSQQKSRLTTDIVNGHDLRGIPDCSFDLSAAYSVLHHVPDYLSLVKEFVRVTKPGGVIYLDHERCNAFWKDDPTYASFLREVARHTPFDPGAWGRKYLNPASYMNGIRRVLSPRFQPEGDIHVWKDDHVEWDKIEALLAKERCEIVAKKEYLLYCKYPLEVYDKYKDSCSDYCLLIARKL